MLKQYWAREILRFGVLLLRFYRLGLKTILGLVISGIEVLGFMDTCYCRARISSAHKPFKPETLDPY